MASAAPAVAVAMIPIATMRARPTFSWLTMKITNSDNDNRGTSRAIDTVVTITDASNVRTIASKRPGVGASSVRR